ncbi:ribonuclease H-like domain-containing protein [Tanacetum coccineum]
MSFDESLLLNFNIVEQEVKETASSSSSLSYQNMAFMSSPSSTNEVNTQVILASTQVSTASTQDLEQIHKDDIEEMDLKWQLALLSMRTRRFFQKTGRKITINRSDIAGYYKSKVESFNCPQRWTLAREIQNDEVPTNMALMSFLDSKADYNYHQRERVVSGNNYTRVNYNYSAKKAHPSAHRNMVPGAVLMKTSLRSLNTTRLINTAHPKTTVYSARPMLHFSKSAQSTVKRPYQIRTTLTNKNFSQKVNTAKGKFYTARPKAVNTARPNSAVVNVVRVNQGHPQKEDQGYVDSGCSRHMTGNMSYLSDFKEFDGGYQNGVAERRNRTLIEAARTMLADSKLPTTFWAEAVNTACYVHNRVLVVKPYNKTPYELFRGRTPALSFMRPFGCHVTILNTLDYLGKFDGKSDEGFFVGYSMNSKAFRVYNIRTRKVKENLHIRFLEDKPIIAGTNSNDLVEGLLFDSSLKNTSNDKTQPSSDAGKNDDEGDNATATHANFFGDETEVDIITITTP